MIFYISVVVSGQFTSPRNKEFYVREFSTVTIPWRFQLRAGFVEISWSYRSGRGELFSQIYSVNSTGTPTLGAVTFDQFKGRLSYRGSTSAEDATLGIERFTKQDEGEFKCEVIGENIITDKVTLQVIGKH